MISHSNLIPPQDLEKLRGEIRKHAPQAPLVETYLEPLFFYRARKKARVPLQKLQNQKVTTFSGVAAPRSFQLLLSQLQIKALRNFEFPDHHPFSDHELREIKEVSDAAFAQDIITTEKDFYRCPDRITDVLNPLVLATRMRIAAGEEQFNELLGRILETKR